MKSSSMSSRYKTFALLGAAGFVAPRHMDAIKHIGGELVAAMDPHDSVGILDTYFPGCQFFTDFGRFERHLYKLKREDHPVDYLVICTPNHTHDTLVRLGLHMGCEVICEKPLAIYPHNVEALIREEQENKGKINTILQLRHHPSIPIIREKIDVTRKPMTVKLRYHAPRGSWYHSSWKGDEEKSGGILMNIGVHFFDLLLDFFGDYHLIELDHYDAQQASGKIYFESSIVEWELDLTMKDKSDGFRGLYIGDQIFDFTDKMKLLHRESYALILQGKGYPSTSVLPSIQLVAEYRKMAKTQNTYDNK